MAGRNDSPDTRGRQQADDLLDALRAVAASPRPGARELYVVRDIIPGGFASTQENVLGEVGDFLASTERVFRLGDGVVFEERQPGRTPRLVPLTEGTCAVPGAEHRLANLVVCCGPKGEFPIPRWFVDLLLRSEPFATSLPEVKAYARRPVFDDEFVLRGPGYHPQARILVHGPAVDPVPWAPPDAKRPAIARLPPHLRRLLGGFCFKADADLANTVGFLLTMLLVGRYVPTGKALALVDGNRPGLGKTLLVRVVGMLADGVDVPLMAFSTDEEEIHKNCAHLRAGHGTVIGLDNAKMTAGGVISSPALESLVSAAQLALRILGKSELFERPNDILWAITANDTRVSPDLVSRGMPIRLHYEDDPGLRKFDTDPVEYAKTHRLELLGELAGMIFHWNAAGRPAGLVRHRFERWSVEVGGILAACGFPEFLTNVAEASVDFNAEGDEFTALAEHVVDRAGPGLSALHPRFPKAKALPPKGWLSIFEELGVLEVALSGARSERAKATLVGQFLTRSVGKTVAIEKKGEVFTLTLRAEEGRARMKVYAFEVADSAVSDQLTAGDTATPSEPSEPAGSVTTGPEGNTELW